mmetsp:Transcript_31247/g.34988  ORF Transcript_31247/g.34988 Transcript_31247/m.34988 type:complete len:120 (-) Transcript_31247:105-464(-)
MVGVVAVDGRKRWNGNGGTVGYGSMIVEKTIGLSAIDGDRDVGKDGVVDVDVDVDEEGRRTPMVVVAQQHCGDDHQKEVIPTNTCYEEEGIAVAALSDDRRIFFLFRGHNSLMECMIGF